MEPVKVSSKQSSYTAIAWLSVSHHHPFEVKGVDTLVATCCRVASAANQPRMCCTFNAWDHEPDEQSSYMEIIRSIFQITKLLCSTSVYNATRVRDRMTRNYRQFEYINYWWIKNITSPNNLELNHTHDMHSLPRVHKPVKPVGSETQPFHR